MRLSGGEDVRLGRLGGLRRGWGCGASPISRFSSWSPLPWCVDCIWSGFGWHDSLRVRASGSPHRILSVGIPGSCLWGIWLNASAEEVIFAAPTFLGVRWGTQICCACFCRSPEIWPAACEIWFQARVTSLEFAETWGFGSRCGTHSAVRSLIHVRWWTGSCDASLFDTIPATAPAFRISRCWCHRHPHSSPRCPESVLQR